jgi:alkanesulfonate monooxygenase SsuD/methylene tetrahydromethanopterin reductase-like flavin-dependent oxidoreductase (luciferase family)
VTVELGIGLPNPIPGTPGRLLVEWARRAEDGGFATLATIDRVAYPSLESLVSLAAAAAVTERIGLLTNILLAPTRNPVLLAKEAATVDRLSGGRLTLGLGVGNREDDYRASGRAFASRGRRLDEDLEVIHRVWNGEATAEGGRPVGPAPAAGDRVPLLFGGMSDAALGRTIRWGVGWTNGGAGPERAAAFVDRLRAAWSEAGREGRPRLFGLSYFALGEGAADRAREYLVHYYGDRGAPIAEAMPATPEAIGETVGRFRDHGYDELILVPTIARIEQLDWAGEAVRSARAGA